MANQLAGKDINFLPVLQQKKEPSKAGKRARVSLALLGLFAIGMGIGFYFYMQEYNGIMDQRESVEAFLSSPGMQSEAALAQEVEDKALVAERRAEMLRVALAGLESKPALSSAALNRIYTLTGPTMLVTELSYEAKAGTLTLRLTGTDVRELNRFVERLRQDVDIADILYTGYASSGMPDYSIGVDEETGESIPLPLGEDIRIAREAAEAEGDGAVTEEEGEAVLSSAYTFEVVARLKEVKDDV